MQDKLSQLAAMPAATDTAVARVLYDEASKFARWLEAHPEDSTPEMLAQARELRNRRAKETALLVGGTIVESLSGLLGGLLGDGKSGNSDQKKSIDVGKAIDNAVDKILGVNDPRMKEFGCPPDVDITKEGASKLCP